MVRLWEEAPDRGMHEIRDVTGRTIVPIKLLAEYQVEGEARTRLVFPASSSYPVGRQGKNLAGQSFKIRVATRGKETTRLDVLLASGRPVCLYHSRKACEIIDCTIPSYQLVWVTSYPSSRSDMAGIQRTIWDISCTPARVEEWEDMPQRTWHDVAHDYRTWFETTALTWGAQEGGI